MNKLKDKFNHLPKRHKGLLIGLTLSTIALFLPWYSDVDTFGSGISYMAISGPASLLGISMLLVNVSAIGFIIYSSIYKRDASLVFTRTFLEKWSGPLYLYMTFVIASVYFHSDFGINVTEKSASFGMYIGALSALITIFSAFVLKSEDFSHVNPAIVEDVLVKEDPEMKESWEKQKELEQRIMDRASGRVVEKDKESKEGSVKPVTAENAFGNSPKAEGNIGSYMYRQDL
jgi:hypothetical protein